MDIKNTEGISPEELHKRQEKAKSLNSQIEEDTGEALPEWLKFTPNDPIVGEALEKDSEETNRLITDTAKTIVQKVKSSGNLGGKIREEKIPGEEPQ